MAEDPIIQVEDVTAGYDHEVILDHVSFNVYTGEVFAILGGSGSGKSTLLKQMIGLYKPVSGKILIAGRDIVTAQGEERLAILRKFGVMYQSGALFGSMQIPLFGAHNVRNALAAIRDEFATPRKCPIVLDTGDMSIEDLVESADGDPVLDPRRAAVAKHVADAGDWSMLVLPGKAKGSGN